MSSLKGQPVIVTGASKGIGAGTAKTMASHGARVVVDFAGDQEAADGVVDEIIFAGGEAIAVQADVSVEDDVRRLFATAREAYGPVRVLVNNAGVWNFGPLGAVSVSAFHRHYDTNVLSVILTSREFAAQPEADGGAIVNLTSVGIAVPAPATVLYTGTKAAIVGTTRVLAVELAARGIRVNAVAAGLINTEGTRGSGFVGSDAAEDYVATIPLRRMGTAGDIAGAVAFLASDEAAYITGDVVFATGGQV